jgi:hypothetical protein
VARAADLELGLGYDAPCAVVTLRNAGDVPVTVLSHVDAGQRHYDWLTIELECAGGTRVLRFADARNESALVKATLAPGETLEHRVDLAAWALRGPNGAQPIAPGAYQLTATYAVDLPGEHWRGRLVSPPLDVRIA